MVDLLTPSRIPTTNKDNTFCGETQDEKNKYADFSCSLKSDQNEIPPAAS